MEENITKNITVLIAGRPYPLKVKQNDEPAIRKIVKVLNEKVNRFQLSYPNKDKQDCLSMALLTYAVDLHKQQQSASVNNQVSSKLSEIETLLDNLLL